MNPTRCILDNSTPNPEYLTSEHEDARIVRARLPNNIVYSFEYSASLSSGSKKQRRRLSEADSLGSPSKAVVGSDLHEAGGDSLKKRERRETKHR